MAHSLTEADKHVLRSWCANSDDDLDQVWGEGKYVEAYATWIEEHRTREAMTDDKVCPRQGGSHLSEKFDDFYERCFVVTILEEDNPVTKRRVIKLLKGLDRSPEIPCVRLSHGVVAIGLDAATQYMSHHFDTQCKLAEENNFKLQFGVPGDDVSEAIEVAREAIIRSLSAFRDYTISNRATSFSSSTPVSGFTGASVGTYGGRPTTQGNLSVLSAYF